MKMKDVTAAIILKDDKVLITRRAPGQNLAGHWEFPGGKIESGETPEECLARELLEELAVQVTVGDKFGESIYDYETGSIRLIAYYTDILAGEINLSVHDRLYLGSP
jgi:8-oxo-dGTP diphosphatase